MKYTSVSLKKKSISSIMLEVIVALIPAILCLIYFYGINYFYLTLNSTLSAVISEAIFLKAKGFDTKKIILKLKDLSAVLTAILLALCMPPEIPWFILTLGTVFAIVIVKQLYGGIGQNIFNPAMVGYCLLLISFPALFTNWPVTENIKNFSISIDKHESYDLNTYDSVTSATPLESIKSKTRNNVNIEQIKSDNKSLFNVWALLNLCYLFGGLYLVLRKIISLYIPLAFILTLSLLAFIFSYINPNIYPDIFTSLLSGSTMIAAFFIITDPVTMPASFKNKLIYSASVAFLTYIIRTFAGYPDGIAFAVILMNATTPLLDKINIPKPFGVK